MSSPDGDHNDNELADFGDGWGEDGEVDQGDTMADGIQAQPSTDDMETDEFEIPEDEKKAIKANETLEKQLETILKNVGVENDARIKDRFRGFIPSILSWRDANEPFRKKYYPSWYAKLEEHAPKLLDEMKVSPPTEEETRAVSPNETDYQTSTDDVVAVDAGEVVDEDALDEEGRGGLEYQEPYDYGEGHSEQQYDEESEEERNPERIVERATGRVSFPGRKSERHVRSDELKESEKGPVSLPKAASPDELTFDIIGVLPNTTPKKRKLPLGPLLTVGVVGVVGVSLFIFRENISRLFASDKAPQIASNEDIKDDRSPEKTSTPPKTQEQTVPPDREPPKGREPEPPQNPERNQPSSTPNPNTPASLPASRPSVPMNPEVDPKVSDAERERSLERARQQVYFANARAKNARFETRLDEATSSAHVYIVMAEVQEAAKTDEVFKDQFAVDLLVKCVEVKTRFQASEWQEEEDRLAREASRSEEARRREEIRKREEARLKEEADQAEIVRRAAEYADKVRSRLRNVGRRSAEDRIRIVNMLLITIERLGERNSEFAKKYQSVIRKEAEAIYLQAVIEQRNGDRAPRPLTTPQPTRAQLRERNQRSLTKLQDRLKSAPSVDDLLQGIREWKEERDPSLQAERERSLSSGRAWLDLLRQKEVLEAFQAVSDSEIQEALRRERISLNLKKDEIERTKTNGRLSSARRALEIDKLNYQLSVISAIVQGLEKFQSAR